MKRKGKSNKLSTGKVGKQKSKSSGGIVKGKRKDGKDFVFDPRKHKRDALTGKFADKGFSEKDKKRSKGKKESKKSGSEIEKSLDALKVKNKLSQNLQKPKEEIQKAKSPISELIDKVRNHPTPSVPKEEVENIISKLNAAIESLNNPNTGKGQIAHSKIQEKIHKNFLEEILKESDKYSKYLEEARKNPDTKKRKSKKEISKKDWEINDTLEEHSRTFKEESNPISDLLNMGVDVDDAYNIFKSVTSSHR